MTPKNLPPKCQSHVAAFFESQRTKFELDDAIKAHRQKLADSTADLAECQHLEPDAPENVRRLTDAMVRDQLMRNHAATLDKRHAATVASAGNSVRALGREFRKIAAETTASSRNELLQAVEALTGGEPGDARRAIEG